MFFFSKDSWIWSINCAMAWSEEWLIWNPNCLLYIIFWFFKYSFKEIVHYLFQHFRKTREHRYWPMITNILVEMSVLLTVILVGRTEDFSPYFCRISFKLVEFLWIELFLICKFCMSLHFGQFYYLRIFYEVFNSFLMILQYL